MRELGNLLRAYIHDSGYTIYNVAQKANVNRTTLQKVLTGERQATEKILNKLIPVLSLSSDEEARIWKLHEILQIGETIYKQRQYIKHLVESVAELDCSFHDQQNPSFHAPSGSRTAGQVLPVPVQGTVNISQLLSHLFLLKYGNDTFSDIADNQFLQSDNVDLQLYYTNQILINAPGNLTVIKQLFFNSLPHRNNRPPISVKHITPFLKPREHAAFPLMNLDMLSSILPFAISQSFHYEVFCLYTSEISHNTLQIAFPYFIVMNNAVILLSCDGQTALPITEPEAINYFRDFFFAALKKASPMMYTSTSPGEILDNLIQTDKAARPFWTIEYQPCLTSFLTAAMVRKYARSDIPQTDLVIETAIVRIQQLAAMEQRFCIFSKAGLMEFARNGKISDLPSCYVDPLQIPDRIRVLKALYIACKQNKGFFRMVNPVTFTLPQHLCFTIRQGHSIDFNGFDPHNVNLNYIHITETAILEAFEDFYKYLKTSDLIYSQEETLREIEHTLTGLSARLFLSSKCSSS